MRVDPAAAERLGPWWFRFEIDDQPFGGTNPRDLDKVAEFFHWLDLCGGKASTILELGSHEGSHSFQLAERPGVTRVLGLEGREDNLARARFVQEVYAAETVEFRLIDIEQLDPTALGRFDCVFCAGLLYHLREPWLLVSKLASVARFLYLDTHYAASDEVAVGPYRGRWQLEGSDPLSGLSALSFWLSFKHLVMVLLEQGFVIRFVHDQTTINGPRTRLFAEHIGLGRAGSVWAETAAG